MDAQVFQIALSLLNGIGPKRAKTLVKALGSAEDVFKIPEKKLLEINGINNSLIKGLNREEALVLAQREWEYIQRNNITLYYYLNDDYPSKLKHCVDGPIVLFGKGNLNFDHRNVAIVGTRKATAYGKKMVQECIAGLVEYDVQVISGLAYGIDIHAHQEALKNNVPTIAVLGTGFENLHPASHKQVAQDMINNGGGLLTEFLSDSIVDPSNFPKRNRIVAGMSSATIVVESAVKGGSMITAGLALDYNRDVFAYPGNADKHSSSGCNVLIKQNKAMLITSPEDIITTMGWDNRNAFGNVQTNLFVELNTEEQILVDILEAEGELDIDHLSYAAKMSSSNMALHLFNLELKGVISSLPGKRYRRN